MGEAADEEVVEKSAKRFIIVFCFLIFALFGRLLLTPVGGGCLAGGDKRPSEPDLAIPEEAAQGFSRWRDVAAVSLPGGGEEVGGGVVMMEAVGAQGLAVTVDANPEALETVQLDLEK